MNIVRPFLVVPKLIDQPTWGGRLILEYKNWEKRDSLRNHIIGQSYELYDSSLLTLYDSSDHIEFAEEGSCQGVPIGEFINLNPVGFLGPKVVSHHNSQVVLIKFTQALGNSFQLHVKEDKETSNWKAKPESWYFLKPGYVSLGLKPNKNVEEYKKSCQKVYSYMQDLVNEIKNKKVSISEARIKAKLYIGQNNPEDYVNLYNVDQFTLVDLSGGELHHSWQEDKKSKYGNFVYEVQKDVKDDFCTLRSFDQGKIKDDGTIRKLTIDEYFANINEDLDYNKLENHIVKAKGDELIRTNYYSMDVLEIDKPREIKLGQSYDHLWVRDGKIKISVGGNDLIVGKGHSAFIPFECNSYNISSLDNKSVVIRTFV